jgi:hypothetical protein
MLRRIRAFWRRLRALQPGERFETFHREQRDKPLALKATYLAVAIGCFAAGVVLLFVPGPGLLLLALSGALLAAHSLRVARALDGLEVWVRGLGPASNRRR